ncbi:MAG: hypothetical protein EP335_15290 [Alphaproteobacteria bacterium]|nr:MAG: hypothetical protein EP335_15290 [Alphaproteobacteria bacterium]
MQNKTMNLKACGRKSGLWLGCLMLVACAGTEERVTFVTTTQLGVSADAKTQSVDIGFSRMDGVIGPVYEGGAVPPIYADIHANASVLNPKVSQTYATGDAALIATGGASAQEEKLRGKRKTMLFGTATNVGLRLGFAPDPSISLGYIRQEYSAIPILKNGEEGDVYGSVLAHIELNVDNSDYSSSGMGIGQFIATGVAAENLAPLVRANFAETASKAMKIVECAASDTAEAVRLQALLDKPGNREELRLWLEARNIDMSPTMFAYSNCYPALQAEASKAISAND